MANNTENIPVENHMVEGETPETPSSMEPTVKKRERDHAPRFTKDEWRKSKRYKEYPDLMEALLQDDKTYLAKEVEKLLESYLNKEVK